MLAATRKAAALALACLTLAAPAGAGAQSSSQGPGAPARGGEPGGPLLRLEAQASREVTDDVAVAVLFAERDGPQPGPLQSAVNATLQAALADLRRDPALQVRTGYYTTQPRYSRDGRIEAWRVRGELVVESGDIAAVSRATATVAGRLNVGSIGFRLSAARRLETENALIGEAAEAFQARARSGARALGFSDFELVESNLNTGMPGGPVPVARMAAAPPAGDAVPLPVEPGRSVVTVTFSGAFRLRR